MDRDAAQGPQAGVHKLDGHVELEQGEGAGAPSRASPHRQGRDQTEREERKPSMKERLEEVLNKPREKLEIEDEPKTEREVEDEREIDREVDRDRGLSH